MIGEWLSLGWEQLAAGADPGFRFAVACMQTRRAVPRRDRPKDAAEMPALAYAVAHTFEEFTYRKIDEEHGAYVLTVNTAGIGGLQHGCPRPGYIVDAEVFCLHGRCGTGYLCLAWHCETFFEKRADALARAIEARQYLADRAPGDLHAEHLREARGDLIAWSRIGLAR